jgi:hypothetical protein
VPKGDDLVTEPSLIASLLAAVTASPDDVVLRLHLAELMLADGDSGGAITQAAAALQCEPSSSAARLLMVRAMGGAAAPAPPTAAAEPGFDWDSANRQFADIVAPRFIDGDGAARARGDLAPEPAYDIEAPGIRLADVGGMTEVKARLEAAFLAPMRNPELSRLYGKSLKGGMLLYGPPVAARPSWPRPWPASWAPGSTG